MSENEFSLTIKGFESKEDVEDFWSWYVACGEQDNDRFYTSGVWATWKENNLTGFIYDTEKETEDEDE
jgi:hypothetical protein